MDFGVKPGWVDEVSDSSSSGHQGKMRFSGLPVGVQGQPGDTVRLSQSLK